MNWEQICILCQTEFEKLEAEIPPSAEFFREKNVSDILLRYEKETTRDLEAAIREFATTNQWPSLTPIQQAMLLFRLDFAASVACLLAQQPAPWTDTDEPSQKEHRLCWLMLFAWDNEGFPRLQKSIQRLCPSVT